MPNDTTSNAALIEIAISHADGLGDALAVELGFFGGAVISTQKSLTMARFALADFYRFCLHTRVASRILLPIATLALDDGIEVAEAVYQAVRGVDFSRFINIDEAFWLRVVLDTKVQANQQFTTLRLKDGIVDGFYQKFGARPNADKDAHVLLYAHIADKLSLYIDISKTSLHRRGYRVCMTDAPIKETLAAALLYLQGWHTQEFDTIIDPMCGSGTLLIEAMLMRTKLPVQIAHEFAFEKIGMHDESLWQQTRTQMVDAHNQALDALLHKGVAVYGFDIDKGAVHATMQNFLHAFASDNPDTHAVLRNIHIEHLGLHAQSVRLERIDGERVFIITNPPYGERLGDSNQMRALYQGLGKIYQHKAGAVFGALAMRVEDADVLPLQDTSTTRLKNGALVVYFRTGVIKNAPKSLIESAICPWQDWEDADIELFNRLRKNFSARQKYARTHNLHCMRLYDADLPQYNAIIDIYERALHIQEYAPPKQIDPETAKVRLHTLIKTARYLFNLDRQDVFLKTRARQSGNNQYQKAPKTSAPIIVREQGALFFVNLRDYLDTGLFLDHSPMRQILHDDAQDRSHPVALNLFAYTCSASVYLARGGASVCSVDLSGNYLAWGKQNFALNGLDTDTHEFIEADAFEWLKHTDWRFDIIFIDPPTFSNSKKFFGTFDVQRDHGAMISRAMNRLHNGGVLYFSNNYQKFVLDENLQHRFCVQEITHKTHGKDFASAHKSYKITHKTLDTTPKPPSESNHKPWQAQVSANANHKNTRHSHDRCPSNHRANDYRTNHHSEKRKPTTPTPKPKREVVVAKVDGKKTIVRENILDD